MKLLLEKSGDNRARKLIAAVVSMLSVLAGGAVSLAAERPQSQIEQIAALTPGQKVYIDCGSLSELEFKSRVTEAVTLGKVTCGVQMTLISTVDAWALIRTDDNRTSWVSAWFLRPTPGRRFWVTGFESWVAAVVVSLTVPVFFLVCAWVFIDLDRSRDQTPGTAQTNFTPGPYINCNTIYGAAQQHQITMSRVDVVDQVRADNGLIYTIMLFTTEVEKTTMRITAGKGGNQGKEVRVKYKILDIR